MTGWEASVSCHIPWIIQIEIGGYRFPRIMSDWWLKIFRFGLWDTAIYPIENRTIWDMLLTMNMAIMGKQRFLHTATAEMEFFNKVLRAAV